MTFSDAATSAAVCSVSSRMTRLRPRSCAGSHGMRRLSLSSGSAFLAARTLSDARLAMGDPEGCLALATSAAVTEPPDAADWARIGWYELLTRAELAAGHPPAATRWADAAVVAARRRDLPGCTGLALLARAQVLAASDPSTASGYAAAARDALNDAGMVLDA